MSTASVPTIRVRRVTAETRFEMTIGPRAASASAVELPNRLLGHFIDHFVKASGLAVTIGDTEWPGSWSFDHVLCEDMGQLVGRGVAACMTARARTTGVIGRGSTDVVMDDAAVRLTLGFEARPRVTWCGAVDGIDGFVDAWFGADGRVDGWTMGTTLRQFIDGFAIGAGACIDVDIVRSGNLHHVYECLFRALGDVTAMALGLDPRCAGDHCGLAGMPNYEVEVVE